MSQQPEVDELFDVKNAYFTGNYQGCINESQKLQPSNPDLVVEKNVYMYRAYLALKKFGVVRDEIGNNSHPLLQPLKTLMAYVQSEGNAGKRLVKIRKDRKRKFATAPKIDHEQNIHNLNPIFMKLVHYCLLTHVVVKLTKFYSIMTKKGLIISGQF